MADLVVGMDVSPLIQTGAGTHRYVTSLVDAMRATGEVVVRPYSFGGAGRVHTVARDAVWYLAALPLRAARDGVDVLHCPTQRGPAASAVPLVVTIHDLAVLRMPRAFNPWTRSYSRLMVPRVIRASRRVIAVSEFTASELVALLRVPREKIAVVHSGVAPAFSRDGDAADGDYVLAVATIEPRKNLERLVDAFVQARLGCELRIVGATGWGRVRLAAEGVRLLGRVSDDELARLYRGARCVAYVSLYEGFGLPVLEAMACGAAVVAADLAPLREIAGDAAVFVNPLDTKSIAAGLREAQVRREDLAMAGRDRARRFSWKDAARATIDVYRSALA
jgi:glycosyltransferase involved in cell wall biosynthesis